MSEGATLWKVSAGLPEELRWSDVVWIVTADSAADAVKRVVSDIEFTEWYCGGDPISVGWAIPIISSYGPSRVDPDRKYIVQEFECLWDDPREVRVDLTDWMVKP